MLTLRDVLTRIATGLYVGTAWGSAAGIAQPTTSPTDTSHEVRIVRDAFGMAHLYSDREEDGFYGLGYAIAEDRLQQVLTWYVAIRGDLAATFGPKTPPLRGTELPPTAGRASSPLSDAIASDINARKYHFLATARSNFHLLPSQYQRDLRAYIAGLRAFMRAHPDRTPSWAPSLEPALPTAVMDFFISEAQGVCEARRSADERDEPRAAGLPQDAPFPLGASNAWAVAGSRTVDGRVIVESDSHGPIQIYGTLFYPYHIKAGDLDFVAFEPTGSAEFLFGHSPYFAWGITEGPRFVADCYRVRVDPKAPRRFRFDGKWLAMKVKPYSIPVKGGVPISGEFEYTYHNGVTSPVERRVGDIAYVVSYASADRIGRGAGEYYRLAMARNRTELEGALAERDAYPANMVIGGSDGLIMYIRPGRVPMRPRSLNVLGTLDGNSSKTAWRGIHSYADALKIMDPSEGYVGNSNVSPDMMYGSASLRPQDFPSYYGFEPGKTNSRQRRLIELLDRASGLSVDDAMRIAMDETIPGAERWSAAIAQAAHDQPDHVTAKLSDSQFLQALIRFDGALSKESRAALYASEVRRALLVNHRESIDSLVDAIEAGNRLPREVQRLLLDSIAEARQHIIETYGRLDLTWGDVHRVGRGGVDLPVGGGLLIAGAQRGGVPGVADYLAVSPPVTGIASLRALTFATDPQTHKETLIGGERIPFVVHFTSSGAQSYAQTLLGLNDDPASPHYSDQAHLASEKQLRPIPLTLAALRREGAKELVLTVP
jgi:acyl-homoserine-lactone acylase